MPPVAALSATNYRLLVFRVAHALYTQKSRNLVPCYIDLAPKSGGDQPQLTQLYKDFSSVKIYFLDTCDNPGDLANDYAGLRKVEEKWMVNMGSLCTMDHQQGVNKKDDAKARTRGTQ